MIESIKVERTYLYYDFIEDLAASGHTAETLEEWHKIKLAHQYINSATCDELFRVFTRTFGSSWAMILGLYITDNITNSDNILMYVFEFIDGIVDDDLSKAKARLDKDSEDALNLALDNKARAEDMGLSFIAPQAD